MSCRLLVALLAMLRLASSAAAQDVAFKGTIAVKPASGRIDRDTGNATLTVRNWILTPTTDSNGIDPGAEMIQIAIGEGAFRLEAGQLKANRKGTAWSYRASHDARRSLRHVRSMRLKRLADGTFKVQFAVVGLDLSRLNTEDPVCQPFAVIIGDDDGFTGVQFTSPTFFSKRVRVPKDPCEPSDWPWA